jgi:hypothetical protein
VRDLVQTTFETMEMGKLFGDYWPCSGEYAAMFWVICSRVQVNMQPGVYMHCTVCLEQGTK